MAKIPETVGYKYISDACALTVGSLRVVAHKGAKLGGTEREKELYNAKVPEKKGKFYKKSADKWLSKWYGPKKVTEEERQASIRQKYPSE